MNCSFDGCDRSPTGSGLCAQHTRQLRKTGVLKPIRETARRNQSVKERLASGSVDAPGGCRVWVKSLTHNGYGELSVSGRLQRAHRVAYQEYVGTIPEGAQVDHVCGNRACIEATHLRVVSHGENQQYRTAVDPRNKSGYRGVFFTRGRWQAMGCKDGKNIYIGKFETPEEAGEAARRWREQNYALGEFDG